MDVLGSFLNRRYTTPQDLWDEFERGILGPNFSERVWGQYFHERWPGWELSRKKWLAMLRYAKENYAGEQLLFQPIPGSDGLRLYRGAPHQSRWGISWTTSLYVARMFAGSSHYNFDSRASVWTIEMAPDMFIAQPRLIEGEMEVLIDLGDVAPEQFESHTKSWNWFTKKDQGN